MQNVSVWSKRILVIAISQDETDFYKTYASKILSEPATLN